MNNTDHSALAILSNPGDRKRLRQMAYYAARMAKARAYLGGKCAHCGESDPSLLDFDHVDPWDKQFEVTKRWSAHHEVFWCEVDRCQLLCVTCHRRKTIADRSRVRPPRVVLEDAPF